MPKEITVVTNVAWIEGKLVKTIQSMTVRVSGEEAELLLGEPQHVTVFEGDTCET